MGKVKKLNEVVRKSCLECSFRFRDYEKRADICTHPDGRMRRLAGDKMPSWCPFNKK